MNSLRSHEAVRQGRLMSDGVRKLRCEAQYVGRSNPQAPAQEGPKGTAGLADCDNCILWSEPQPSDEGHCWHRAIRECRGGRVARLESGCGEIRADPRIAREISEFIEERQVLSVAMTDGIIGCPHQEGIDYEGEWCPFCEFWRGRDRFTGQAIN
jgi:hypothetical protein